MNIFGLKWTVLGTVWSPANAILSGLLQKGFSSVFNADCIWSYAETEVNIRCKLLKDIYTSEIRGISSRQVWRCW